MPTAPVPTGTHFAASIDSKPVRDAIRARIVQLDATLASLAQSTQATMLERQKLLKALDSYRYPTNTLPHEILSEVFIHTLEAYPGRPTLAGKSSPWSLGRVCKTWYEVMLSTHRLWARLDLDETQHHHPRFMTHGLPVLEKWLKRSGVCPLSIRFHAEELGIKFLEALLRHATRWQDVDLEIPFEFFHRLNVSMPMLRKATLDRALYDDEPSVGDHPLPVLTQALQLETMVLKAMLKPMSFALPLSRITTLSASVQYSDVFKLLSSALALEICELELWPPQEDTDISPLPLPLPHLHFLRIIASATAMEVDEEEPWSIQDLCGALTVPALQDLAVEYSLLDRSYDRDSPSWLHPLRSSPQNPSRVVLLCHDYEDSPRIGRYEGVFPEAHVSIEYGFLWPH
ncbi:hypothetical protein FB45DRAFT_1142860 [Roridomyces roridus]|uniref:F-box domain-containing protein n=1 Tax=Roridomyces roridus TaxID=1738132 RepID=A0AAD7BZS7_9AGAR|nr:hypothetical protein FB45DRAFT_1142860 [Roridomyces roridus]